MNPSQQNVHKTNNDGAQNENHVDDMIELNSCGIVSRFRFPMNRKRCLNMRCNLSFGTRAEAIRHYRAAHSRAAIYCEKCNKPVHTKYLPYWQYHCEKWHPQTKIETETKVAVALKSIDTNAMPSKSSDSGHSSKPETTKMMCPLRGCSYKSRRIHKLRKHWDKLHGSFRFPIIHGTQLVDEQSDVSAATCAEQKEDVSETKVSKNPIGSSESPKIF